MIYQGVASGDISYTNKYGATTQIGTSAYYSAIYDNTYVGYMKTLNDSGSTTSSNGHENNYDSNAKAEIDSWYKTNIVDKGFSDYVDINTGFCNDRQTMSGGGVGIGTAGYGSQNSAYAPSIRLQTSGNWRSTQTPSLQCANKTRDLFTVSSASEGNKKLTYPVGLISSDEVVFAGGFGGYSSTFPYIYTNQIYWTMSPYVYNSQAFVFMINDEGSLIYGTVSSKYGLRPVINLRTDTKLTGSGSETDPYIVV